MYCIFVGDARLVHLRIIGSGGGDNLSFLHEEILIPW